MHQMQLGSFGDQGRADVGGALLTAMHRKRSMCLRELADGRNQELQFSRFLDNSAVSRHEMLVAAGRRTAERAAGRHVLVLADTSECNYAGHTGSKRGFGTVGNGKDIGVFVPPLVAVDAEQGGVLGLVGAAVINRTAGKPEDHKTRLADEKESRRWLAGMETAGEVLADAAVITGVEDREGDIYDQFARRPDHVHLLVRAAQNRSVGGGEKLFARRAKWREAGYYSIQVPAKRGLYKQRTAKVPVRFGEVTVRRPGSADKALPAQLTLRVVDVREENPPQDPKQRVHWCLLTTHAVGSPEAAMQIVGWYKMRWLIEPVFRVMKTDGVDVETSQITTPAALLKLVTIALIAAVRVVQLVTGRNANTGQALTDVADPRDVTALRAICASLEGRTEKLRNPHDPTTLAWYHWIAARLGGWSGYTSKGYSPAGPKTIARGLKRLDAMVEGWWLASHSAHVRLG